jgi:hypothetical protein
MAGVTVSGVLWAIFQNNAGGAWDNAKKSFEKGVTINGETYYKKSEPHKAAVVGDTVGDPFKDTSGPSMNILIKLSSLIGLTIAPLISMNHGGAGMGKCEGAKMECSTSMECCKGMNEMGCAMDADGNCIIDSAVCAEWMAEGKIDSTACVKCEGGKCYLKHDACKGASMSHCQMEGGMSGAMPCGHAPGECTQACMDSCKAKGMECGKSEMCKMKGMDCGKDKAACMEACKAKGMNCAKEQGCSQTCMDACKAKGINCDSKSCPSKK